MVNVTTNLNRLQRGGVLHEEEGPKEWAEEELRALNAFGGGDVDVSIYPSGEKSVYLNSLRVSKGAEPGTGTRFMQELIRFADKFGFTICRQTGERETNRSRGWGSTDVEKSLKAKNAKWKNTTSSARLKKFYRRFGFQLNSVKGRYDLRGNMHRLPNKKQ